MVSPGKCLLTTWTPVALESRQQITHDVIMLTFKLSDQSKPLGLSTCACILARFHEEGAADPVVRPYTPVSTNAMIGKFQLVVKIYPGGKMSQHMKDMPVGDTLEFNHIEKNVKMQYPFGKPNLTMLVGGTGITPMIQALHAILGSPGDATKVTLIFGNKTQKDILCGELLDTWGALAKDRLKVVHVLSDAKDDASWTGAKGFIDRALLDRECPPAAQNYVMVCGPPPMYNALCGPRDQEELTGLLKDMGYTAQQVYKF